MSFAELCHHRLRWRLTSKLFSCLVALSLLLMPIRMTATSDELGGTGNKVKHVLLISVDGLHALDLTN